MKKQLRLFLGEYITSMVAYWICTGFIIAKLTEYFHLSLGISNFLTSLSSMFLILQPLGGILYARTSQKRKYLIVMNLVWRLSLCFVFFSVFFTFSIGSWIFCICLLIMQSFQQLSSPAYEDWHVQAAEREKYNKFYSVREVVFMILYTVMLGFVQIIISFSEHTDSLKNGFVITGVLESILLIFSICLLFRLPAPYVQSSKQKGSFQAIWNVLKNKLHTQIILANASWCFANVFIGGLFGIYAVRILKLDFIQLMIWGMAGNILRTVFAPIFSNLASKIGWKNCVSNIFIIYAILAFILYISPVSSAAWTAPLYLSISALPVSGLSIGILKMRIACSSEEMRSVYFSAFSLISGMASLLGTFICSFLLGLIESNILPISIQSLFLIGFVLLIFPFYLFKKLSVDIH